MTPSDPNPSRDSTSVNTRRETRSSTWVTTSLAVAPVVVAFGLAGLYAVGALLKTTQLRGADLSVQDTLTLVPLPQILATGIGTVATAAVIAPVLIAAGAFIPIAFKGAERLAGSLSRRVEAQVVAHLRTLPEEEVGDNAPTVATRHVSRALQRARWVSTSLLLGIAAVSVIVLPWTNLLAVFAAMVGLTFYLRRTDEPRPLLIWLSLIALIVALAVVRSYAQPRELPVAVIDRGARSVVGNLIVATDSTWYLKTGRREITAVQLQAGDNASFWTTRNEPETPPSLSTLAFGWPG